MLPASRNSVGLALVLLVAISIGAYSAALKPASENLIEESEIDQLDGSGDSPGESWPQLDSNSSSDRSRRQTDTLGSIGVLFGLTCPEKSASTSAEANSMSAEILLHRTSQRDDISIAGKLSSEAQFRLSIDRLLENAGFQRDKPTIVYMPGWMQTAQINWLRQARKTLDELVAGRGGDPTAAPVNLMIVDYAAFNSVSFARSASMVPYVGQVLANFLQQLIDKHSYSADKIHIVSYSLSTHIAGVAGRLLKDSGRGQVAQITAIDPTGVCFHRANNEPFDSEFGLKPGDAKLVLARHYDMKQLGAGRPIGGVDVFVNGGSKQPRMDIQEWNALDMLGATSLPLAAHHRAIQHEAASSAAYRPCDCQEVAYECPSLMLFQRGQCADCGERNQSCALISTLGGYTLDIQPENIGYANGTQMHLMTGVKRFCTYNYQVVARIRRRPPIVVLGAFERGQASFELQTGVSVAPMHKLNETAAGYSEDFVTFTMLLRLGANQLRLPDKIGCPSLDVFDWLESLEVNYMSNISPEIRNNKSARYCPEERNDLKLARCR